MKTLMLLTILSLILLPKIIISNAVVEDKDVFNLSTVWEIKGHLFQAIENKKDGNITLTSAHASHPIAELYSLIEDDIKAYNLDLANNIEKRLKALPSKAVGSLDEFKNETSEVESLIIDTIHSIIPLDKRESLGFHLQVMVNVLDEASIEYAEGVEEGKVANIIEYQDAQGFVIIAYNEFRDEIKGMIKDDDEAMSIENLLEQLINAMESKRSADDIKRIVTSINDTINPFLEQVTPLEKEKPMITKIKELLKLALNSYNAGRFEEDVEGEYDEAAVNYEKAKQLIEKAYTVHYEPLKDYIQSQDPELMLKTESILRDELIKLIDEGKPVSDIEAKINEINSDIDKIVSLGIVPEFPVNIALILTSIISIMILFSRFNGIF
jgi:hypothetical protein